jgi:hypothetical protein
MEIPNELSKECARKYHHPFLAQVTLNVPKLQTTNKGETKKTKRKRKNNINDLAPHQSFFYPGPSHITLLLAFFPPYHSNDDSQTQTPFLALLVIHLHSQKHKKAANNKQMKRDENQK